MMNFFAPRGEGLVMTAWQGVSGSVLALIEAGADVNQVDQDGASVLMNAIGSMEASDSAKLEIVKLLVEAGCDVNYRDPEDDSAIALAATEGLPEVVEYLLAHGANLQITTFRDSTVLESAELAQSREAIYGDPGWFDDETARRYRRKAELIARCVEILKQHGAKTLWELNADKVGQWIRITPHCRTGLLTDSGHLTIAQLPGATQLLGERFNRWFEDAIATRLAADRALTPAGFDRAAHNALGWHLACCIKKLVPANTQVELLVVLESPEGSRSGLYKTVGDGISDEQAKNHDNGIES